MDLFGKNIDIHIVKRLNERMTQPTPEALKLEKPRFQVGKWLVYIIFSTVFQILIGYLQYNTLKESLPESVVMLEIFQIIVHSGQHVLTVFYFIA